MRNQKVSAEPLKRARDSAGQGIPKGGVKPVGTGRFGARFDSSPDQSALRSVFQKQARQQSKGR